MKGQLIDRLPCWNLNITDNGGAPQEEFLQHRIIHQIRTTLDARIAKEPGERVVSTAGFDNDNNILRREFGSDKKLDELGAAGWLMETGGRYGRHELWQEQGPNLGTLFGAAQIPDPVEVKSHIKETNREARENSFITTR